MRYLLCVVVLWASWHTAPVARGQEAAPAPSSADILARLGSDTPAEAAWGAAVVDAREDRSHPLPPIPAAPVALDLPEEGG